MSELDLNSQLAELESAQLVHPADGLELTYLFKHALTRESAHESLLRKDRREMHRRVARVMESIYADRIEEYAPILAQHYMEAGDDLKTMDYAARAGDASARLYANSEAIAHYDTAIQAEKRIHARSTFARSAPEILSEAPAGSAAGVSRETVAGYNIRELYLKRGREFELASQFPAALANYLEMEKIGQERKDGALELGAITARCQVHCTASSEFNPALGEPLAKRALRLALELGDHATESKILWILVNLYRLTDRLDEAREAGEESLRIARALNLREQMAYTLNDISHAYSFSGNFKRSRESIQEATRLWRELGNLPMLADSLSTASMSDSTVGEFDELLTLSAEASKITREIGNLWGQTYSISMVGIVHWMRGESARAIQVMEETLRLSELSGYPVPQVMTRADLGLALGSLGAFERGLAEASRALDFADAHYAAFSPYSISALVQVYVWKNDAKHAEELTARLHGASQNNPFIFATEALSSLRVAIAQSDPARALVDSARLLGRLDEFSMRTFMPEAHYLMGLAQHALGQIDTARESLHRARRDAEALTARWPLWQILGALGELEATSGNPIQAEKFLREANELILFIAGHAPAELRESYLNLPQVQKVKNHHVEK